MSTLPATIPGLVLPGNRLRFGNKPGFIALNVNNAEQVITAANVKGDGAPFGEYGLVRDQAFHFALDMNYTAGTSRAKEWIAGKLGMDASGGATWTRVADMWEDHAHVPKHYILRAQGEKWQEDPCVIFCEASDKDQIKYLRSLDESDFFTVEDIVGAESNVAALRLAVLAVAGVQG